MQAGQVPHAYPAWHDSPPASIGAREATSTTGSGYERLKVDGFTSMTQTSAVDPHRRERTQLHDVAHYSVNPVRLQIGRRACRSNARLRPEADTQRAGQQIGAVQREYAGATLTGPSRHAAQVPASSTLLARAEVVAFHEQEMFGSRLEEHICEYCPAY